MIKMEIKNRKGWKMFSEADVEAAKSNGWTEVGVKPAPKKAKKAKGDK